MSYLIDDYKCYLPSQSDLTISPISLI